MDSVEVEIPEDFLIRWLEYIQNEKPEDQRLSKDDIEKYAKDLIKSIKWNRILEQIAKDLDIKLERQDAIRTHADYIKSLYSQFGVDPGTLGDEFFLQQAEGEYDKLDENQRTNINLYAFENKVLDALMEKVKLEEREVTEDMLNAMLEGKQQEKTEEKQEESEQKTETTDEQEQNTEKSESQTDTEKSQEKSDTSEQNHDKSEQQEQTDENPSQENSENTDTQDKTE